MSERIIEFAERCAECLAHRRRTIDIGSGRYVVDLPSHCVHKDACENTLMRNYDFIPDPKPGTLQQ